MNQSINRKKAFEIRRACLFFFKLGLFPLMSESTLTFQDGYNFLDPMLILVALFGETGEEIHGLLLGLEGADGDVPQLEAEGDVVAAALVGDAGAKVDEELRGAVVGEHLLDQQIEVVGGYNVRGAQAEGGQQAVGGGDGLVGDLLDGGP